MILVEDRQMIAARIAEAQRKGARLKAVCELAGLDLRTLQRWKCEGLEHGDRRPHAPRPAPAHALSAEERAQIVQIAKSRDLRSCRPRGSCRCWRMKGRTLPASPASVACCGLIARCGIEAWPRCWASRFGRWYNYEHRHSGIRYVSAAERHNGRDAEILAQRHALYVHARAQIHDAGLATCATCSPLPPSRSIPNANPSSTRHSRQPNNPLRPHNSGGN